MEKYEIFKAVLSERLKELKLNDIIEKIENAWLDCFYKWIHLKNTNEQQAETENDEEEIIEMRCIEFLCRYVHGKKSREKMKSIESFDCVESKATLVGKLNYINEMTEEEFQEVGKYMEDITQTLVDETQNIYDKPPVKEEKQSFQLKSDGSESKTGILLRLEDNFENKMKKKVNKGEAISKKWIYEAFCWSLRDTNRDYLKYFYNWKETSEIKALYDKDALLAYHLSLNKKMKKMKIRMKKIKNELSPYWTSSNKNVFLYPGYRVDSYSWGKIPQIEIEAYYYYGHPKNNRLNFLKENKNIIRIHHLFESEIKKKTVENEKNYNFVFTNRDIGERDPDKCYSGYLKSSFLVRSKAKNIKELIKCGTFKANQRNAYMVNAVPEPIARYLRNESELSTAVVCRAVNKENGVSSNQN